MRRPTQKQAQPRIGEAPENHTREGNENIHSPGLQSHRQRSMRKRQSLTIDPNRFPTITELQESLECGGLTPLLLGNRVPCLQFATQVSRSRLRGILKSWP